MRFRSSNPTIRSVYRHYWRIATCKVTNRISLPAPSLTFFALLASMIAPFLSLSQKSPFPRDQSSFVPTDRRRVVPDDRDHDPSLPPPHQRSQRTSSPPTVDAASALDVGIVDAEVAQVRPVRVLGSSRGVLNVSIYTQL